MATGQSNEAFRHHPIFADIKELSLEGPANEVCGTAPFRQAYVSNNLWQGLVSILTVGIYTPRTLQVWCGDAKKNI